MPTKKLESQMFQVIWWTLAVLLPDLLGFATRDWRAAIAGAAVSGVMILLSLRASARFGDAAA
jgi:hypothetical protein